MAIDAIITLNQLRCIRKSGLVLGGAQDPYIWFVLVRIDDNTLMTDSNVDVTAHGNAFARVVIKNNIRIGESADIPSSVGVLRVRFEDNLTLRRLIPVVALWDKDETPQAALRAGYDAFRIELGAAIGDDENLFALSRAEQIEDEEERNAAIAAIIETIETRVRNRVESAIWNSLTSWQKTRVFLRNLDLDDLIGTAFNQFSEFVATSITLAFGAGTLNEFEIDGELQVRPVLIELCQAEVDRVKDAQAAVDGIDAQIEDLNSELDNASPSMRPFILDQLNHVKEVELPAAMAVLEEARRSLQACRDRGIAIPGGLPVPTTRPIQAGRVKLPTFLDRAKIIAEIGPERGCVQIQNRIAEIYSQLVFADLTRDQQEALVNEVSQLHDHFVRNCLIVP